MYRILSFCVLMSRIDDAYIKLKVYYRFLKIMDSANILEIMDGCAK